MMFSFSFSFSFTLSKDNSTKVLLIISGLQRAYCSEKNTLYHANDTLTSFL